MPLFSRRNVKVETFLKRCTERRVHSRIRAHELCVVISEHMNKAYMHAVLCDEHVLITEYAPRTLTAAVSFRRVRNIQLVNDLPEFLSGRDRKCCQHIQITFVTDKPPIKGHEWLTKTGVRRFQHVALPSGSDGHCPPKKQACEGYPAGSEGSAEELRKFTSTHVISSLDPETLNLFRTPHPPNRPLLYSTTSPPASLLTPRDQRSKTLKSTQVPHRISSALRRLLHRDDGDTVSSGEEQEAELHLYIVSQTSRFYLQLRSSWSRFVIRSTLLLDPVYRRKCRIYAHSSRRKQRPVLRTCQLFNQLSSELLQDQLSVEGLYLLLQELNTAAHRNLTLPTLFWRSGELCAFLVQTLEENLNSCQSLSGVYTPDHMLLSTMIVETLTVMFAETRNEAAKLSLLSSNNGTLVSRMLLALICDPQPQTQSSVIGSEFQVLMSEYQDAACSLLFELLLLGHEIHRSFFADDVLSAGWILGVLQTHSHLPSFMTYQAQQVVLALSDMQGAPLSPTQAVLLFQRCHLLLLCLQHSSLLAQHLTSRLSEEFRYLLRLSQAEEKLPPRYPITSPILCLLVKVLALMLHR